MQVIQEINEIEDISNWFIVDVGYSSRNQSSGILRVRNNKYTDKDLQDVGFSKLKKRFNDFYEENKNKKIGLVLEAPLSILFNKDGNPLGRGFEIEFSEEYTKKGNKKIIATRYWYYGAGATVTLGALEFIKRIESLLANDNIYLFEGFVSFKNKDIEKEEHYKDAELLYKAIKNHELHEPINDAEKYKFIGSYLNLEINGIPPIIKVSKDKNEIFII